jgi:short-subunit dehydrogenase involved in D-alanine esterification of teichoic acids
MNRVLIYVGSSGLGAAFVKAFLEAGLVKCFRSGARLKAN